MGHNLDTYCAFEKNDSGHWKCQNLGCGFIAKKVSTAPPIRICRASPKIIEAATEAAGKLGLLNAAGNLAEDAIHYAQSLARWTWAGFPVRSAENTAIRYEICSGCDKFARGKCTICGCPVKKKRGMLIKNKAALLTETCPHPGGTKWP